MSFVVSHAPIDREAVRELVSDRSSGACIVFEGWIRDHNEGRRVERLEYEIYEPVAVSEGRKIMQEAGQKFDIRKSCCVHRDGLLELGETAVMVVVSAAHRDEAFRACRYIIDEVKHRLPVWKKEYYADGDAQWVNCRRCNPGAPHAHGRQADV
jgi:molybdopterin synthase catalytic subunit